MHVKMIRLSITRKIKSKVSADSDMLGKLKKLFTSQGSITLGEPISG